MPHTSHCKFCVLRSLQLSIWLKDLYNSCFQVYVLYIYLYNSCFQVYDLQFLQICTILVSKCTIYIYIKHTLGNKNCKSLLTI